MNGFELEIIKNLNLLIFQGWIIVVLLAGCLVTLMLSLMK